MKPKTPEEALAFMRDAAAAGDVEFASDTLCAQLDEEIQSIYRAIRSEEGKASKRRLWTADGQRIDLVLDWSDGRPTQAGRDAVRRAGEKLGIELSADDLWEDAALRLRDRLGRGAKH